MQTHSGATQLMYACQQCREKEVLEILRKQPYSVKDRDRTLKTPLHYCAENQSTSSAEAILQIAPELPYSVKDRDRTLKTPLHYCAENQSTSCAEAILQIAPELVNAQDENGYCTLHLAVIAGNKPLIKFLITKSADINIYDKEGHSIVHWAIVSSEKEALDLIIRAGANPSTPDIHGGYPLHYAVQMCGSSCEYVKSSADSVKLVETLLNFGVDVNVKDKDGRQPILWAASAGSADAVIHLVSGGACVEAADKDGLTALHCAASRGHTNTLETLVTLCGSNVDVIDGNGCSALFYAVTLGHADATELLLQLGAEPNRQDRKGRTPAHCGAAKGQLETLKILKKHGGNLWSRNVKGDLPLHEAVASGRKDLVFWLLSQNSEAINIANNDGRCPMHIAAMYNNTEMVKVIKCIYEHSKSLVNPVMRTSKGILMTPLNVALCKGHRSCGKFLQLHGGVPFSKVSKIETTAVNVAQISPSEDMINRNGETTEESPSFFSREISNGKNSFAVEQDVKIEGIDKKKVYRRRKKRKTSFNVEKKDSDSEDSVQNLKVQTPDSRKSEKRNENNKDNVMDEREKRRVRADDKFEKSEKIKYAKVVDDENYVRNPLHVEKEKELIKEKNNVIKRAECLQKHKSFSETKNVSDLSPEDFPPQMQIVGKLDTVIKEAEVEPSKPPSEDSKPEDVLITGLSNLKQELKINMEKNNEIVKVNNETTEDRNEKRISYDESKRKESLSEPEKPSKNPKRSNGKKGERSSKSSCSRSTNDESFQKKIPKEPKLFYSKSFFPFVKEEKFEPSSKSSSSRVSDSNENFEKSVSPKTFKNSAPKEDNCAEVSETISSNPVVFVNEPNNNEEVHNKETTENNTNVFFEIEEKPIETKTAVTEVASSNENDGTKGSSKNGEQKKNEASVTETNLLKLETDIQKETQDEEPLPKVGNNSADEEVCVMISELDDNKNYQTAESDVNVSSVNETTMMVPDKIEIKKIELNVLEEMSVGEANYEIPNKENNNLITSENIAVSFKDSSCPSFCKENPSKKLTEKQESINQNVENVTIEEKPLKDQSLEIGPDIDVEKLLFSKNNMTRQEDGLGLSTEKSNKESEETDLNQTITETVMTTNYELNNLNTEDGEKSIVLKQEIKKNGESDNILSYSLSMNEEEGEKNAEYESSVPYSKETNQWMNIDSRHKPPRVSRVGRRHKEFKSDLSQISITQLIQNTIRKYHMERGIFYQLLELKRLQIRAGRANEQVLVKRLADEYERSRVFIGMKHFSGLYKFKEFEKFLYEQLKALNSRNSFIMPEIKSYDDIDALSGLLKKSRYKIIGELPQSNRVCTCITQRCHHSVCAYTSVPCSAYIAKVNHRRMCKTKNECFLPRIDQPPNKLEKENCNGATLELVNGNEKQVIVLPKNYRDKRQRYYVTFTIKGSSTVKEEEFFDKTEEHFKHRHAKSV